MRAIDADKFKKLYESYARLDITIRVKDILEDLDNMPTIEPMRKKGKWNHGLCSVCGYDWGKDAPIANVPPFCPKCGAKMGGDINE